MSAVRTRFDYVQKGRKIYIIHQYQISISDPNFCIVTSLNKDVDICYFMTGINFKCITLSHIELGESLAGLLLNVFQRILTYNEKTFYSGFFRIF